MEGTDISAVAALARTIGGEDIDPALLDALCAAAAAELAGRLRPGVNSADIGPVFSVAAAVLALGLYAAAGGRGQGQGIKSFRAGNLSVTCGGDARADGAALRAAAEGMLAAYLTDRGFGFLGVPG